MTQKIVPFTQEHLQPAVELFIKAYRHERLQSPLLPFRAIDEPDWIFSTLHSKLSNPGIALLEQDRLLAFMITGENFKSRGQQAAFVPEYAHAAVAEGKQALYQSMYQSLAQVWVDQGRHLHLIGHFAHDVELMETLHQLGFGALLAERLRDVSSFDSRQDVTVKEVRELDELIDLHIEHILYYRQSPIFIARTADRQSALSDLESHVQDGDVIFAVFEANEPCAYMIAGRSNTGGEGFLLQETNTAQIKSAYMRPGVRGKGIGRVLLQQAIRWCLEQGYERIFVEHETANIVGGAFWSNYFEPYLNFSMRYVDNTL